MYVNDAFGAEQSVIGSMLIDEDAVGVAVASLTEEDFRLESSRTLFKIMKGKYLNNEVVDPVTVLGASGESDRQMIEYVQQLMLLTPTSANITEYIRQTKENSKLRRLKEIGTAIYEILNPNDAMEHLARGMDLLSQEGRDDESDSKKTMHDFWADIKRKPEYIPWGFRFLDENVYAEPGDFVILAGRPSDGKTALALHMAYEQAKILNVGFFSLETSRLKLGGRLISSVSGVPLGAIKQRTIKNEQYALLVSAMDEISKRNITFVDAAGWTAQQIEARTLARKFDLIYIDYLQLIAPSSRRDGRTAEVADISRSLATLARRHKVAVVALSQLSRPEQKTKRRAPVLADLRESGQIEQDADAVMFIWRQSETDSKTQRYLTLAKNKEGVMGDWDLCFRGEIQRFIPEQSGKGITPSDLPEGWSIAGDECNPFERG